MTDRYVRAGVTSGSGLTYDGAYATFAEAHAAAADGDRIICDGLLVGSAMQVSTSGYATISKSLEIISYTDYSATFAPSVTTAAFTFASSFAKSLIFGDITISGADVAGGATPNYALLDPSTVGHSITFNGTRITSTAFYAVYIGGVNSPINLDINGLTVLIASAGRSAVYGTDIGATAVIDIADLVATFSAKNHSNVLATPSGIIVLDASQAGATCSISRPIITSVNSANGNYNGGIFVRNIPKTVIKNPNVNVTCTGTSSTYGIEIDCNDASLTAHNSRIEKGVININANAGIAAIIGHDSSTAADNLCNNGVIREVTAIGSTASKAGNVHGLMHGNNTGGATSGGAVSGLGIGVLSKQTTDTVMTGVESRDCSNYHHYHKGATRARSVANRIIINGATGVAYNAAVGDAAQNNSNCFFGNNDIGISGAANKIINTTASQGVTFGQNRYWLSTSATVANPAATILGTDYATLALANAAADPGAQVTSNSGMPSNSPPSGTPIIVPGKGLSVVL